MYIYTQITWRHLIQSKQHYDNEGRVGSGPTLDMSRGIEIWHLLTHTGP
jgi:hypothetical protein